MDGSVLIPWWFGLVLAGLGALVFLWPDPDLYDPRGEGHKNRLPSASRAGSDSYDRTREDEDDDSERDRDPEVERRWFGVESWGGDENG